MLTFFIYFLSSSGFWIRIGIPGKFQSHTFEMVSEKCPGSRRPPTKEENETLVNVSLKKQKMKILKLTYLWNSI